MCGTIPPLPNTPPWRGAGKKKVQGQLYLYLQRKCWDETERYTRTAALLYPLQFIIHNHLRILQYI
jgi:hypothetical protein